MNWLITANYPSWAREELKQWGNIFYKPWTDTGTVLDEVDLLTRLNEIHAQVLITEVDKVTARVLTAPTLQAIGVCRGTPVNVDIHAATEHGILVFRTPGRNAQAVAELALGMSLILIRRVHYALKWVAEGHWTSHEMSLEQYHRFFGRELYGKTVGLVGYGAVAKAFSHLLKSFNTHILYYDPYVRIPEDEQVQAAQLRTLFSSSDIVSLHLPSTQATYRMIDGNLLKLMQPDAILINTSRASVIDRDALYALLKQGRIAGAALDVLDTEPLDDPQDQSLAQLPNVLITPHIGGATAEIADHQALILNQAFRSWKNGICPPELVNPEIWNGLHQNE